MSGQAAISRYTGSFYQAANPLWHAEDAPWKAAQIASLLSRNGVFPRTILDVGCGTGGILKALVEASYPEARGVGYDIARYPIAQAARLPAGVELRVGDVTTLDVKGFDVLICIDVFEHVENYMGFLRSLRGRARHYVFHIPLDLNLKAVLRGRHMRERVEVGHLHYFDKASALATLRDTGFTTVDQAYTKKRDPHWKALVLDAASAVLHPLIGMDPVVRVVGGRSLIVLATAGDGAGGAAVRVAG